MLPVASFTKSVTAASLADPDAIKTAVASSTDAVSYSGADLNGLGGNPGPAGTVHGFAAYPTATLATAAGAYTAASTITWTGTYRGKTVTRTGTIVGTGGNETVTGDGPLETCTQVDVAAQADTDGSFTFGWADALPGSLATPKLTGSDGQDGLRTWTKIVATSAGNARVRYAGGREDTVPLIAGQALDVPVERLYASSTTANVTVHST